MKPPCEMVVWYVIPAIRSELAIADDLNDGTATKADIISRTCYICKRIKTEDILCQIHREHGHVPADCKACLGSALEL